MHEPDSASDQKNQCHHPDFVFFGIVQKHFHAAAEEISKGADGNRPGSGTNEIPDDEPDRPKPAGADNKWRHGSDAVQKSKSDDHRNLMRLQQCEYPC